MAYSKNPHLPKVRGEAVEMVRKGWSTRMVSRHFGFSQSAVSKWCMKARRRGYGDIPTESSKPKRHPNALPTEVVSAIISERVSRRRCSEHVYHALKKKGVPVSLSSIKRTLARAFLLKKRSPWKRPHDQTLRPEATHPGALLQADTIHIIAPDGSRIYIYTLIDLHSRFAYAEVTERISAEASVAFIRRAILNAPFTFEMIQTDHGTEFSTWFTHCMWRLGMKHRHSRVRQSNDNAHVERFNRTIQEECLDRTTHTILDFKVAIADFLPWYNNERSHMGINYKTPLQLIPRS
jgi:transposase InsO family protein